LLISSISVISNSKKCVSMDVKFEGDLVYAVGFTIGELGASEYYRMQAEKAKDKKAIGGTVPRVDGKKALESYNAISNAIEKELVASIQPVGLGGLGVAMAKKCIAGRLGAKIDLKKVPGVGFGRTDSLLFSESQSRFLVTIAPENKEKFEAEMNGTRFAEIGIITGDKLEVTGLNEKHFSLSVSELEEAYKKTLRDY